MGGSSKPRAMTNKKVFQEKAAADAKAAAQAQAAENARIEAEAKAQAEAELKAEKEAARLKAIRGGESASDIAARTQQTTRTPRKARLRGRRSLLGGELGSGALGGKESLS